MVGGVSDYVFRSHVFSCEDVRDETRFDWRSYITPTGLGLIIKRVKDKEINYMYF